MDESAVIDITMRTLELALKLGLPLLLSALVVGLLVSVFQAVTQIQEMTLSFIPKILAMVVVIVIAGPWMLSQLTSYTRELYGSIPERVGR
ncbi:MAG: flagellar biosynthesis protein FliQ [Thermoleophilia bacterium]